MCTNQIEYARFLYELSVCLSLSCIGLMCVLRGFTFILAKIATWQCTLQQKFEMKEEEELRAQSHPF